MRSRLILVWILSLASCSSAVGPTDTPSSAPASAAVSKAPALSASLASPASLPSESPRQDALRVGGAAITIVDGVRVRSAPTVDDASMKYAPVLPEGTPLFVADGPTISSGYDWWQVVPLDFPGLEGPGHGWVAAASREGEPWIHPSDAACPSPPEDLAALVALTHGMVLACFSRQPITVRARLVACHCDVDGPATDPSWLGVGDQPILLVDPSQTKPPDRSEDWFILHADPDVWMGPLPLDEVVDVTGSFDHPAAEGCLVAGLDEPPTPSISCRFAFTLSAFPVVEP